MWTRFWILTAISLANAIFHFASNCTIHNFILWNMSYDMVYVFYHLWISLLFVFDICSFIYNLYTQGGSGAGPKGPRFYKVFLIAEDLWLWFPIPSPFPVLFPVSYFCEHLSSNSKPVSSCLFAFNRHYHLQSHIPRFELGLVVSVLTFLTQYTRTLHLHCS